MEDAAGSSPTVGSNARLAVPAVTPPAGVESARVDVRAELARDLGAIEQALGEVAQDPATRVERAAGHGLLGGGKRVRPLLTCAVLRALGTDPAPHVARIAAVELAHAGSLLHDDVIDETVERRGLPTAHRQYDTPTAVLAGDHLVMLAVEQLARRGPRELLAGLCTAVRELCAGESLERERRFDVTVDLAHVRRVNRLKTAALFAYAAEAGATLADAAPHVRRAARTYGLALGEAFQVTDDHLDYAGDPQTMGKPTGQDLLEGVVTLPLAIAFDRDPTLRERVQEIWRTPDERRRTEELDRLRDRMDELGALADTLRLATSDTQRAAAAIRALPPHPWRDRLASFAMGLVRRDT